MKRIAAVVMILVLAVFMLSVQAAEPAGYTDKQKESADILYTLGLFRGSDKGYELGRNLTRGEAAALLTRLLGGEAEALAKNYPSPFTDLPDWVKPYVGWLYHQKLTKGMSATTYSPNAETKYEHFVLFMGRAAGLEQDEHILQGFDTVRADEIKENTGKGITRGQATEIMLRGLANWHYAAEKTLAAVLCDKGVLTPQKLDEAVTPVLGCSYVWTWVKDADYTITRQVFYVPVAQSTIGVWASSVPFNEEILPKSVTAFFGSSGSTIYAIDPMTLEPRAVYELDERECYWSVLGTLPDAACLLIADKDKNGSLYIYDEGALTQVLGSCCSTIHDPNTQLRTEYCSYARDNSMIVGGLYGIVSFDNSGQFERLSEVRAETLYVRDNAVYYVPKASSEDIWKAVGEVYREGFLPGGLEIYRIGENKQPELLAALDGRKYGMMISEIVSVEAGGTVRFKAEYMFTYGMMDTHTGMFVYELRDGVPAVIGYEGSVPQDGTDEGRTLEQWLELEAQRLKKAGK